jgi:hypothetical protein
MKNKDQVLLETAYNQILEDFPPTSNTDVRINNSFSDRQEELNDDDIEDDNENEDDIFVAIAAEFLSRANPSDKIFDLLSEVKEKGMVPELVDFLNKLGEEDESNWVAKDKLIEFLFQYYS